MTERAHDTRDRLLAIASELFHRNGFAGTSFDDIVRVSGIRRGNIYYYFKTKDDILEGVVARRMDDAKATIRSWCAEISDPRVRLERFIDMVFGRAAELAKHGCPIGTLTSELGKGSGERKAIARSLLDVYRDFAVEQMRAMGFRPALARELVTELLARCQGAAVVAHAYGDPGLLERRIASIRTWLRQIEPREGVRHRNRNEPPGGARRRARTRGRRRRA